MNIQIKIKIYLLNNIIMKPTAEQQKLYDLAKAKMILEDNNILEASQKTKIKDKKENILNSKKNK